MRRFGVLGPLLAFALVGAACGGDEALSKDEYIAQGNAICEDANAQVEPGDFIDQFTAAVEGQLADLRDLAAPEGDENLLAALYDDVEAVLDEINQLADAAAGGDPAAIERLTSDEDPSRGSLAVALMAFDELDKRAIEHGLTVCGE